MTDDAGIGLSLHLRYYLSPLDDLDELDALDSGRRRRHQGSAAPGAAAQEHFLVCETLFTPPDEVLRGVSIDIMVRGKGLRRSCVRVILERFTEAQQ